MKTVFAIRSKGEGYTANVFDNEDGSYEFTGDMDVDVDGSPNWDIDKSGDPDTTLHHNGKPINSQKVPGIVLPPECIKFVHGIVIGCKSQASWNGVTVDTVVFDVGPHFKLGEGSAELARRLKINDNPNDGGLDEVEVLYKWWPGIPAVVDGVTYDLTPYGHK